MSKFIDKTLLELARHLRDALFSEEYASIKGFLQDLDGRVKIIGLFLLLINTIFMKDIFEILISLILFIILAKMSHISLRYIFKRVILFMPIFTAIIALPYIFNIFQPSDGTPLLILFKFDHEVKIPLIRPFNIISITQEGLWWAIIWVLRVTTSISFMTLLIMTTKWSDLLRSFNELKVPSIFVLLLGMTFRYIFLLLDTLLKMLLSRKSRIVGKEKSIRSWKSNSNMVGALFIKSYELGNNVYSAMVSRGFMGEFKSLRIKNKIGLKSYIFLALVILYIIILFILF